MADRNKIVPGSAPGNFFVDTTCINCDNCRILAGESFGEFGDYAGVKRQPVTEIERRRAMQALICCPTGSIGTRAANNAREVMEDFPMRVADDIYYLGFNSPKSYGGKSYVVLDQAGNWMVDAPKFVPRLVSWLAEQGGLRYIFLTHRDDCADAAKFASKFGCQRIIHEQDLEAQPDAECVLRDYEPVEMQPGFLIIPTPGHTEGHCMLLCKGKYLFSGDVFTSDRWHEGLEAYDPRWCWYSWEMQTESIEKLTNYEFEWVLPGHGRWMTTDRDTMREQLKAAIKRCREEPDPEPCTAERLANLEMYAESMRSTGQRQAASRAEALASRLRESLGL